MIYFGFDHHKRWTQAVAMDEQGRVLREGRVLNDSASLKRFLRGLPKPWKGVVEAGPTWGWIYDTLDQAGVEMIVAHPSHLRAIAEAKIKTDKIDARMLANLLRVDLIPASMFLVRKFGPRRCCGGSGSGWSGCAFGLRTVSIGY